MSERYVFEAQAARLKEVEHWLSLMILRHGDWAGSCWQYEWTDEAHTLLSEAARSTEMPVIIEYDQVRDMHVLTTL